MERKRSKISSVTLCEREMEVRRLQETEGKGDNKMGTTGLGEADALKKLSQQYRFRHYENTNCKRLYAFNKC